MMTKLTTILALFLSATATTSAFVAPRPTISSAPVTPMNAINNNFDEPATNNNVKQMSTTLTTALVTAATPLASFAAAAQDDDYVYGAVAAPGGLTFAWVLGVAAILTAAVPVLLAPGEDAFNEMKEKDKNKWRK